MNNRNKEIWEEIYSKGLSNLEYPNEMFVRLFNKNFVNNKIGTILDYGFGAGANLIHMAKQNCEVFGVEVSESAISIVQKKLAENSLTAELLKIEDGRLPFEDNHFDMVVAWQVLVYNNLDTFKKAMSEINRVLKPGGLFLGTMTAVRDISHVMSDRIGDYEYTSKVPSQEGATCIIVDKGDLQLLFEDKIIDIGEYYYDFGNSISRHWIVTYKN
ncbi:class I SAM-dependent methyltransferase [Lysinibacillus sp. OL1_EC]|uniref:class I SAM-dependent methyltransferase n=1 Tax=unclassified Lysinibacillus TaxID=2636778 RepID=UPI00187D6839|nr:MULTISPECIES: class I SAM-dependent methyltransferase [unclassified Lysinibacillus]MCM0626384.1 class I SAM-dependent methyltransferase [Lysinibacillus sp. OL1_EC]